MSYRTEVEEEGGISRGPWAGEAGAAWPWWQGGRVAPQPTLGTCFKGSVCNSRSPQERDCSPHIKSAASVDEKPLEGRDPVPAMWRPCWVRASCPWLWAVMVRGRWAVVSARGGSALQRRWGEEGKWPAASVAGPGAAEGQAGTWGGGSAAAPATPHAGLGPVEPDLWSQLCRVSRAKVRLVHPFSEPRLLPIPTLLFEG